MTEDEIKRLGSAAIPIQLGRIADSLERYETHIAMALHLIANDEDARAVLHRIFRDLPKTQELLEHISEGGE